MNKQKLVEIANDTSRIVERGFFHGVTEKGESVSVHLSIPKSSLIHPEDWEDIYSMVKMLPAMHGGKVDPPDTKPVITVEKATTLQATFDLVHYGDTDGSLMVLNFASGRRPGGGWLDGTTTQEESLARSSNLVMSLEMWPRYYRSNRTEGGRLYTDHAIWSPEVAFFRLDNGGLIAPPFYANVLTIPAPNLSNLESEEDSAKLYQDADVAVNARIKNMFTLAAFYRQKYLVLGAWGCGVFANDPVKVSQVFKEQLQTWGGYFKKVVFAIYDTSRDQHVYNAFDEAFSG